MTETVFDTGEFTVNIHELKTTIIDGMQDVIKFVTWSMEYKKDGIVDYAGPFTTEFVNPTPENFIPFSNLNKEQVVSWINSMDERVPGVKNYLQQRVDKELEKAALTTKAPPWAPMVVVPPAPPPIEPVLPPI